MEHIRATAGVVVNHIIMRVSAATAHKWGPVSQEVKWEAHEKAREVTFLWYKLCWPTLRVFVVQEAMDRERQQVTFKPTTNCTREVHMRFSGVASLSFG